ncbi:hypothetical protein AAFF_G00069960 [Aldrovandia affinis]|uniref:B30.2/SPRY domain-containing protein n=1 Tax=Aldrovandia affinis TaxID=143900 RepID=A0AAD7R291_9TELE|nr:hypothetical protein AAFF_G00069960 [Aldrovandia affinis]
MESSIGDTSLNLPKRQRGLGRLETEIGAQFEKMHAFLRKREAEVKRELLNEERKCLESMDKNLVVIRDRLMGRRETEAVLLSALAIAEPDYYLQESVDKHVLSSETHISVNDLQVTPDSLCLGPYETHLQFFMWKDMLQVIRSVPEPLAMKNDRKGNLIVSVEGSSVWPVDKETGFKLWPNASSEATTVSREWFHYGQHYWEVHVGGKLDWTLGVRSFLWKGKGYIFRAEGAELLELSLDLRVKPSKVGLYLDSER